MKKRTLKEELQRIHTITYGKKFLIEDDLLNKLIQGGDTNTTKTVDDPMKADFVDDNVKKYFIDLKSINEPIEQQELGSMEYQKNVELVQIGLILLGYELPRHGVDGLFGPETAVAVGEYKQDNNIVSESSSPYKGGGNITVNSDVDSNIDERLQDKIESIASEYGKPFRIKSGYRDPKRNATAGGASDSAHLRHNAVDIGLQDESIENTLKFIAIASKNGIGGIGVYGPGSIHIDLEGRRSWGPTHKRASVPSWAESTIQDHLNSKIDTGYVSNYDPNTDNSSSNQSVKQTITPEMVQSMATKLESKGITKDQLDKLVDKVTTGGGDIFTDLDLLDENDYKTYVKICELYLKTRQPNPLGITGTMLADGAKSAFIKYNKYVPPELALSQLAAEGGVGDPDVNNKPVRTRNPYNIANMDDGSTRTYPTIQSAIDAYFNLIARSYLGKGKTSNDLIYNFVNHENQRYAKEEDYEDVVKSIAKQVKKIANTI
jgi:hypothetical protein